MCITHLLVLDSTILIVIYISKLQDLNSFGLSCRYRGSRNWVFDEWIKRRRINGSENGNCKRHRNVAGIGETQSDTPLTSTERNAK